MIHRYSRTALIVLSVIGLLLAACAPTNVAVAIACNFAAIDYLAGGGDGDDATPEYVFIVRRSSDNTILGTNTGQSYPTGSSHRTVVSFPAQLENTVIRVSVQYGPNDDRQAEVLAEAPCTLNALGPSSFEPGDDRINVHAYASAAIYCDDANQRVSIYGIDSAGEGFEAIAVPYASLPATPAENVMIDSFDNIRFFRLNSGEYQVNVGPDAEGKQYLVVWDGCPATYVNAYIYQNGVATPTELRSF